MNENININDGEYLFTTKKACCEKWFGFAPDCANFTILIIQITFAPGNQSKTCVYGRDLNLTPSMNVVTPSSLMTEMHVAHVQVWEVACDPKLTQLLLSIPNWTDRKCVTRDRGFLWRLQTDGIAALLMCRYGRLRAIQS